MSEVLSTGAPASGHHRDPLIAVVHRRSGFRWPQIAGGRAEAGKQQRAARCGDVGLSYGESRMTVPSGNC